MKPLQLVLSSKNSLLKHRQCTKPKIILIGDNVTKIEKRFCCNKLKTAYSTCRAKLNNPVTIKNKLYVESCCNNDVDKQTSKLNSIYIKSLNENLNFDKGDSINTDEKFLDNTASFEPCIPLKSGVKRLFKCSQEDATIKNSFKTLTSYFTPKISENRGTLHKSYKEKINTTTNSNCINDTNSFGGVKKNNLGLKVGWQDKFVRFFKFSYVFYSTSSYTADSDSSNKSKSQEINLSESNKNLDSHNVNKNPVQLCTSNNTGLQSVNDASKRSIDDNTPVGAKYESIQTNFTNIIKESACSKVLNNLSINNSTGYNKPITLTFLSKLKLLQCLQPSTLAKKDKPLKEMAEIQNVVISKMLNTNKENNTANDKTETEGNADKNVVLLEHKHKVPVTIKAQSGNIHVTKEQNIRKNNNDERSTRLLDAFKKECSINEIEKCTDVQIESKTPNDIMNSSTESKEIREKCDNLLNSLSDNITKNLNKDRLKCVNKNQNDSYDNSKQTLINNYLKDSVLEQSKIELQYPSFCDQLKENDTYKKNFPHDFNLDKMTDNKISYCMKMNIDDTLVNHSIKNDLCLANANLITKQKSYIDDNTKHLLNKSKPYKNAIKRNKRSRKSYNKTNLDLIESSLLTRIKKNIRKNKDDLIQSKLGYYRNNAAIFHKSSKDHNFWTKFEIPRYYKPKVLKENSGKFKEFKYMNINSLSEATRNSLNYPCIQLYSAKNSVNHSHNNYKESDVEEKQKYTNIFKKDTEKENVPLKLGVVEILQNSLNDAFLTLINKNCKTPSPAGSKISNNVGTSQIRFTWGNPDLRSNRSNFEQIKTKYTYTNDDNDTKYVWLQDNSIKAKSSRKHISTSAIHQSAAEKDVKIKLALYSNINDNNSIRHSKDHINSLRQRNLSKAFLLDLFRQKTKRNLNINLKNR